MRAYRVRGTPSALVVMPGGTIAQRGPSRAYSRSSR